MKDFFRLAENQTSVRTEVMAGITTFLTMAYIIFLQPAILSGSLFGMETGMEREEKGNRLGEHTHRLSSPSLHDVPAAEGMRRFTPR